MKDQNQALFEGCLYFNLATLSRQVTKIWQEEFSALNISPSHGYLLVAMAQNPLATQKDLSALMELDASTVARFIDTLAGKGLVEKNGSGKGTLFKLTPPGQRAARQVHKMMDALFTDMQGIFGKNELSGVIQKLQQTRQNLKENAA